MVLGHKHAKKDFGIRQYFGKINFGIRLFSCNFVGKKGIMADIIFKRKIYSKLKEWKETSKGKTALLLEGARRIGKSTIVEKFAQKEYRSYILIDFNEASKGVKGLFDDLMDMDYIFLYLQNIYKTTLYERESVIIFDEVQQCPKARQAINAYLDTNNLQHVDMVKRQILQLYADDFRKIDPTGRISKLFMAIPSQLSRNLLRYQPTPVVGKMGADKIDEMILCLEDSKTVNVAYHADDPNVGMSLTADYGKYKLYISDTGLFVTMAFWDKDFTENIIYQKLLNDKLSANLGYVYENLIAQMLRASGNKLFYYTFPKDDTHSYEVDFLLSRGNKLCPIEVKSSGYKTHASLDAFCLKYSDRISQPYLLYTKDFHKDGNVLLMPIYMTPLL